ncbi:uncharacterized protein LOC135154070 [Lytechinus pictus]|uniref:uncharacterized protein LOC135154070 n=1 Tax=Lytechinus pictus TaxID=7653 RepID=UPI0030B9E202
MLQVAKNLFTHLGKFKDDAILWSQMPLELASLNAQINLHAPHSLDVIPLSKAPLFTFQVSFEGTELDVGLESLESCDSFGRVRGWRDMSEKEVESVEEFLHLERSLIASKGATDDGVSDGSDSSSTCSQGSLVGSSSSSSAGSRRVLWDSMETETLQALTELGFGSSVSLQGDRYPLFKVAKSSGTSSSSIICAKSICSSDSCPHSSTTTLAVPCESLEVLTSKPSVSLVDHKGSAKSILCECCYRRASDDMKSEGPQHDQQQLPSCNKKTIPKVILTTPGLSECLLFEDFNDVIPCECYVSPSGHLLHTVPASGQTVGAGIKPDTASIDHQFSANDPVPDPQSNNSYKVFQSSKALLGTDDADRLLCTRGSTFQLDWNSSNVEIQQIPQSSLPVSKGPSLQGTCRWAVLGSCSWFYSC